MQHHYLSFFLVAKMVRPNFVELTYLGISNNRLTRMPESIEQLIQLEELDLSNNLLAPLPPVVAELIDRKVVNLSGNPLRL